MPSPVGHTLAGLCGFLLAHPLVKPKYWVWLLGGSIAIANLPDVDVVPGLVMGDPRMFHHQVTHSFTAAVAVGGVVGSLARRWNGNAVVWGVWACFVYLSHVVLDLLVNDPSPPFGAQVLWPFSQTYFIAPFSLFLPFDYFDPAFGVIRALLSWNNLLAILQEVLLLSPWVGLAWYVGKGLQVEYCEE